MTWPVSGTYFESAEFESAPPRPRVTGRLSVLTTLFLASILIGRQLVWRAGFTVSQRLISAVFATLTLAALALTFLRFRATQRPNRDLYGLSTRLGILAIWIPLLAAWGLARGNWYVNVGKEAAGFEILVLFLALGRYDAFWTRLRKPLVILLYASFAVILLTFRTPGVITTTLDTVNVDVTWIPRNLDTVGYSLRSFMYIGLLLGALGLVQRRTDIWRVLQVGGLLLYFIVNALLFEFRGAFAMVIVLFVNFVLILPLFLGKFRLKGIVELIVLGAVALFIAMHSTDFTHLLTRFHRENLFESRILEAKAFFADMGPLDLVIGRGLSGTYVGPAWARADFAFSAMSWSGNHFGFLGFVLRGGFLLLLFMTAFAVPIFLPKPPGWYRNEYNLAAFVLIPLLLFDILLNPILFDADSFFIFMLWGLCFARFSCADPEIQPWELTHEMAVEY